MTKVEELRRRLGEIKDLARVASLVGWDQQVMMPPAAASARADQLTTLGRILHERATDPALGEAIDGAEDEVADLDPDSDQARLVQVARHDFEKAVRVPADLRAELTRAEAEAYGVWVEAREKSDYALFRPSLERILELVERYIACFPAADEPYDILLDDYEQGAKTAEVRDVFARLKAGLVPLVRSVAGSGAIDSEPLRAVLPLAPRMELQRRILERIGFDPSAWRLDPTVHPFETAIAIDDIRLTTRYEAKGLENIFSSMHEFGHGLYEHQVSRDLDRTPLARGTSLGWHESQSLLWENLIGRSRAFSSLIFPDVRELLAAELDGVDESGFYRMVNKVEPDFIRVEADEVTYNLHVLLRFELEQELLSGKLPLGDLPDAWNGRMEEYLGVSVPEDRLGVLQDVHWSHGSFGYFPTYTLGYLLAAQLWQRIEQELPIEEQIAAGEFAPLREWLRENLHRHGRKFTPAELQQRLLGGTIDPEPFLAYLQRKLTDVYGQTPAPAAA